MTAYQRARAFFLALFCGLETQAEYRRGYGLLATKTSQQQHS